MVGDESSACVEANARDGQLSKSPSLGTGSTGSWAEQQQAIPRNVPKKPGLVTG